MARSPDGQPSPGIAMATPTKFTNGEEQSDDGEITSTFHPFPATRPFINSHYRRQAEKPVVPFPESNQDGIYSAMKNLQEKVQRLELERTAAEDNLKTIAMETTQYTTSLQKAQEAENLANTIVTKQTRELESQLTSAETRCNQLEKQLDEMRKLVHHSQQEQLESAKRRLELEKRYDAASSAEFRAQVDKIAELEREHVRLTATQTLSENKIRELENKLREEDIHRNIILERAAELQARTVGNHYPTTQSYESFDTDDIPVKLSNKPKVKKTRKKKKKKMVACDEKGNPHPSKSCSKHNDPCSHYRLNLAEIPFVAGTSTGPSHSVGANVQKVISMMKSHNLALCSSMYNGRHSHRSSSLSSTPSVSSLDNDMTDILQQLQDEFGQLSLEHQELASQIEETSDLRVKRDLRRELDRIVRRLETKSQQISKVRSHQQKITEWKNRSKHRKTEGVHRPSLQQRPLSARPRLTTPRNTVNSRPSSARSTASPRSLGGATKNTGSPRTLGGAARNVLNDMRKLQTTLRKDDVSWD